MSQQFYSKYRHLFEDEMFDQVKLGYDMQMAPQQQQIPQFKFSQQQPKFQLQQSPIKQESPFKIGQLQSQYKQPQVQSFQASSQERTTLSRKNFNEERIRKQVMQDNIFKQPSSEQWQTDRGYQLNQPQQMQHQDQPLQERKQQQQTYNVFQDQDILDDYAPKKQRVQVQTANDNTQINNVHKVYLQRLNDLDYIRKKYLDPKQLSRDIDQHNPYKAALMQRILAQMNGNQRKSRLKDALKN
ncbi:unnamed protein product (macronuclear) [Paramecium tetraurelia]|uniref:Uncharacterized protein n=1 Tax=Paramecium tetraurelia TaxID=5888 RepID=A0C945_PARTE|nr:uncharacterized protein GSPATT00006618001 [Paramecium tetraurelia]CAK67312.1 unnamed protein product [Paramecium tetraurelia]|eukprot:XP_001434709.1 hypothetical protein (macronuclear) [Paramecium tetraurelia strain d4-2]